MDTPIRSVSAESRNDLFAGSDNGDRILPPGLDAPEPHEQFLPDHRKCKVDLHAAKAKGVVR